MPAYVKQTWVNGPGGATPLSAARLQWIEDGLDTADVTDAIAAKGDLLAGTAPDTIGVRPVGADGQVLAADSAQATGLAWVAPWAVVDAKGDLIVGTAADTVARVPVGADGRGLRADSSQSAGVAWQPDRITPSADKVASYTLVAADAGTRVVMNLGTALNLTVPNAVFTAGDVVEVWQRGAGQVTVVAEAGTTMRAPLGTKTRTQYSTVRIWFASSSEFVVDLDAAV